MPKGYESLKLNSAAVVEAIVAFHFED